MIHSRSLENLWFYECPDLDYYPGLSLRRKLKQLRLPCGDFKGFKGLRNNRKLTEFYVPKEFYVMSEGILCRSSLVMDRSVIATVIRSLFYH